MTGQLALADGGVVRMRERAGPFLITLFSSPAELSVGPADISVLVQARDTGEVVLEGSVDLTLVPPGGVSTPIGDPFCGPGDQTAMSTTRVVEATHGRAVNKLLYSARVEFPAAGAWQVRVRVRHRDGEGNAACVFPVIRSSTRRTRVWPGLVLPPVMVGVFVLHQRLRRRMTGDTG